METLAKTLGRSVRTVQRHLHLLKERGLIEFIERRRNKGRFSSYLYRVLHIVRTTTTGHGRPAIKRDSNIRRTKRSVTPPISPPNEGYNWLFDGKKHPEDADEYDKQRFIEREKASKRRKEGYEWLFE